MIGNFLNVTRWWWVEGWWGGGVAEPIRVRTPRGAKAWLKLPCLPIKAQPPPRPAPEPSRPSRPRQPLPRSRYGPTHLVPLRPIPRLILSWMGTLRPTNTSKPTRPVPSCNLHAKEAHILSHQWMETRKHNLRVYCILTYFLKLI